MWEDDKVFNFGSIKIHSTKARSTASVRWYLEIHKDGAYWSSHGSRMPLRILAALEALVKMPRHPHD